jgi:hypothetical protein
MIKKLLVTVFLIGLLHCSLYATVNLSALYPTNLVYGDIFTPDKFKTKCQNLSGSDYRLETNEILKNGADTYNYLMCNRAVEKGREDFPSKNSVVISYTNIKVIESRFWYYGNDIFKFMVHNAIETDSRRASSSLPDTLLHYSDSYLTISSEGVESVFEGELYGRQKVDEDELVITGNMYRVVAGQKATKPAFLIVICIDRERPFGIKDLSNGSIIVADCRRSTINDPSFKQSNPEF